MGRAKGREGVLPLEEASERVLRMHDIQVVGEPCSQLMKAALHASQSTHRPKDGKGHASTLKDPRQSHILCRLQGPPKGLRIWGGGMLLVPALLSSLPGSQLLADKRRAVVEDGPHERLVDGQTRILWPLPRVSGSLHA